MRRLKLSTKMLVAALPLILAVSALLALTVRDDLQAIDRAENGADLGRMWGPLLGALTAIETEAAQADGPDAATRRNTDDAINLLRDASTDLNAAAAAGDHITASRSSLSAARRGQDIDDVAPDLQVELDPVQAYAQASREIVAVGQLLPSEAGDPALGRELLAVVKLAEAKLAANAIITNVEAWEADPSNIATLRTARDQFGTLETALGEFEAIAPEEWAAQFRQAGFTAAVARSRGELDAALRFGQSDGETTYDISEFETLVASGVQFQAQVSEEIVHRASGAVDAQRAATLRRLGIALGVTVLAVVLAWLIARSITKRIRAVSAGAQRVTADQLPALVEALRDPRGQGALPAIEPVISRGSDEVAELAESFNTMQGTLVDVAHQQVEVLRRGVSDIFVTMARRNRSLIDRQLAMLDEFEAEVDDPEVLANYYQLDHMATRMRRNSESLLVLANAEPKRRRVKATEIDDVVRAAIGEVEDYRRIEIEALESLQVRGNVVADVSHLLAELLDNATSFSPPDSVVRIGGRMSDHGYMVRIVDAGVGIGSARLTELNALLREPPVVGLSVESTLGMSVVSLLANKHGITVTLASGNPGLIVDVVLPPSLFGPIDAHAPIAAAPSIGTPGDRPVATDAPSIVAWDDAPTLPSAGDAAATERFEQIDPYETIAADLPTSAPVDEDRPVTTSDWRNMSLSLSAFQTGMQSAQEGAGAEVPDEVSVDASDDEVETADSAATAVAPAVTPDDIFGDLRPSSTQDDATDHIETLAAARLAYDAGPSTESDPADDVVAAGSHSEDLDDGFAELDRSDTDAVGATELDVHTGDPEAADEFQHAVAEPADAAVEPEHATVEGVTVDATSVEAIETDDEPVHDDAEAAHDLDELASAEAIDVDGSTVDSDSEHESPTDTFDSAGSVESADDEHIDDAGDGSVSRDDEHSTLEWALNLAIGSARFDRAPDEKADADDTASEASHVSDEAGEVDEVDEVDEPVSQEPADDEHPTPVAVESEPSLPADEPVLPPPGPPKSEFDHPPAPPLTVAGPSATPVSPGDARPIPNPKVAEPAAPKLPTRTPSAGPDGGPDRLAEHADGAASNESDDLPTRRPADPVADIDESPTVTAADPDALRDRLRAFQAEFRSALGTDSMRTTTTFGSSTSTTATNTTTDTATDSGHPPPSDPHDLGGDRR